MKQALFLIVIFTIFNFSAHGQVSIDSTLVAAEELTVTSQPLTTIKGSIIIKASNIIALETPELLMLESPQDNNCELYLEIHSGKDSDCEPKGIRLKAESMKLRILVFDKNKEKVISLSVPGISLIKISQNQGLNPEKSICSTPDNREIYLEAPSGKGANWNLNGICYLKTRNCNPEILTLGCDIRNLNNLKIESSSSLNSLNPATQFGKIKSHSILLLRGQYENRSLKAGGNSGFNIISTGTKEAEEAKEVKTETEK